MSQDNQRKNLLTETAGKQKVPLRQIWHSLLGGLFFSFLFYLHTSSVYTAWESLKRSQGTYRVGMTSELSFFPPRKHKI